MLRSLTITLLCSTAAFAQRPIVPVDSRAWRMIDAIDELFDAKSTPLARKVACARLVELGTGDWALRLAANYDSSPEIRAVAWESVQVLAKLTTNVQLLHNRSASEAVRLLACDRLGELAENAGLAAPVLRMASLMDPSDEVRQRAAGALRTVLIALAAHDISTGGDEIAISLNGGVDDESDVLRPRPVGEESESLYSLDYSARASQMEAWKAFIRLQHDLAEVPRQSREILATLRRVPANVSSYMIDTVQLNIDQLRIGVTAARYQAILHLTKLGPLANPAMPAVTKALKDEDADIRDAAAWMIGTPQARRIANQGRWIDELSAENVETRSAGARHLADDQFAAPKTMQTIIESMKSPPIARRALVAAMAHAWREEIGVDQALAQIGKQSKDPVYRQISAIGVKILAADSAEEKVYQPERATILTELKKRLWQAQSSSGMTALRMLRELGIKPAEFIGELNIAALSDNAELRYQASQTLIEAGDIGFLGWAAMLKDPRPEVRGLALSQVEQLGPRARLALETIISLLQDRDPAIRRMSATALGTLGPLAKDALNPLLVLRNDTDPDVREQSLIAARHIAPDDPRIAKAVHQLMRDPNLAVRDRARAQVPILQGHQRPDPAVLIEQLRSQNPLTRRLAAKTIADEAMVPDVIAAALVKAVDQGDFAVREGLVQGIEQAWAAEIEVDVALKKSQDFESNPAKRAYAKAALRAVTSIEKEQAP